MRINQGGMPYEIVVSDPTRIKSIKTTLEKGDNFIKPIVKDTSNTIIRTNIKNGKQLRDMFSYEITLREYDISCDVTSGKSGKDEIKSQDILSFTKSYFQDKVSTDELHDLLNHVPTRYSVYPPLLLLNNSTERTFTHECFQKIEGKNHNGRRKIMDEYYQALIKTMPLIKVIGINKPIEEFDLMRQPHNLQILYSSIDDDLNYEKLWCEIKQNGIWQVWNPMYTMFSRGNIKEKKRILDTFIDVEGNDVVDLYCGIGYFSFSYMKLQCRYLFGFELNKWSTEGLKRGLELNKYFGNSIDNKESVIPRYNIYNENNEMSNQRIQEFRDKYLDKDGEKDNNLLRLRHINLGLLPSSEQGWPICIELLSNHHNWIDCPIVSLHIHENVHIDDINNGKFIESVYMKLNKIAREFEDNNDCRDNTSESDDKKGCSNKKPWKFEHTHLEKIKTFAPDVWHICLDVDVTRE